MCVRLAFELAQPFEQYVEQLFDTTPQSAAINAASTYSYSSRFYSWSCASRQLANLFMFSLVDVVPSDALRGHATTTDQWLTERLEGASAQSGYIAVLSAFIALPLDVAEPC